MSASCSRAGTIGPGVTLSALCPNAKGFERARAAGLQEIAVFMSASETHNMKNTNKSIERSLEAATGAETGSRTELDTVRAKQLAGLRVDAAKLPLRFTFDVEGADLNDPTGVRGGVLGGKKAFRVQRAGFGVAP